MDLAQHKCLRKVRYATEDAARAKAAWLRRHGHPAMRAYPCDLGGERHWHVGTGKRR